VAGVLGDLGSRKYLLSTSIRVLRACGWTTFDIFYHHRPDPVTPLEETMGGPRRRRPQGKGGLCRGQQLPGGAHRSRRSRFCGASGTPPTDPPAALLNARPLDRTSLPRRPRTPWGRLDRLFRRSSGLLTRSISRRSAGPTPVCVSARMLDAGALSDETLDRVRALNEIAQGRGQIAGPARDRLGPARRARDLSADRASSVAQLEQNVAASQTSSSAPTSSARSRQRSLAERRAGRLA